MCGVCGRCVGGVWGMWEVCGRCVGGMWEVCGRCVGCNTCMFEAGRKWTREKGTSHNIGSHD